MSRGRSRSRPGCTPCNAIGNIARTALFELWLTGLLDNMLGPTATSNVAISFEEFAEGTVCRLDVGRGKKPTFVRGGKGEADLYVRLNNSTRLLNTADALEYVTSRWR